MNACSWRRRGDARLRTFCFRPRGTYLRRAPQKVSLAAVNPPMHMQEKCFEGELSRLVLQSKRSNATGLPQSSSTPVSLAARSLCGKLNSPTRLLQSMETARTLNRTEEYKALCKAGDEHKLDEWQNRQVCRCNGQCHTSMHRNRRNRVCKQKGSIQIIDRLYGFRYWLCEHCICQKCSKAQDIRTGRLCYGCSKREGMVSADCPDGGDRGAGGATRALRSVAANKAGGS